MAGKMEQIPELLSSIIRMQRSQEFSGPLPQEILKNLTQEDKDKLINNFIDQESKDHEKEILLIKTTSNFSMFKTKMNFGGLIVGVIGFLILTGMCLYSNNSAVLFDILKIFAGFAGGYGVGVFNNKNSKSKSKT